MENFSDVQIGLAIKAARQASGLSAKQLAERCGLTPAALSKIENGKQVLSFAYAQAMCSIFGIKMDHLVILVDQIPLKVIENTNIKEKLKLELKKLEKLAIKTAISLNTK